MQLKSAQNKMRRQIGKKANTVHLRENLSGFLFSHWSIEVVLELVHKHNQSKVEHEKLMFYTAPRRQGSFM